MADIEPVEAEQPEPDGKPAFRDPTPSVERISQLAGRVLTGDILLPRFQRDFVWPRDKVLGLLDSIALNYPIGSVLLWQSRQELASERTIAGLEIAATKPDYPVNYLLDGQQRLSTVCGALYWNGDQPDSLWNIAYDLNARQFLHLHTLDDPPLSQVPTRYLAEPATFFKRVTALDNAELRERAEALFNRFQNYMIAAVTLADMSIDDIAPIFERINSTATALTIVDLMRAATWSPDFDLRDSIDDLLKGLSTRSYDGIDRKTMLRAVSAAAGFGFAVDDIDRLRGKSPDELRAIINEVEEAARRAVDFLTGHIKAPRPQSLPYANQFAVLTELFRRITAANADQFRATERWFWRSTLSGYFGGWNTGQMAHDWRAVEKFSEGGPGAEIEVPAALPRSEIWRLTQFRSNSAVSKMLALLLSYQDVLDLLTGQRIDPRPSLSWSTDKEFHHFFPRDYLKRVGVTPGRANAAGNIVLLGSASNIAISNMAPADYLQVIIDDVGYDELLNRCRSCLVPEEALKAALKNDYDAFLVARSDELHRIALHLVGEENLDAVTDVAPALDEVTVEDGDVTEVT